MNLTIQKQVLFSASIALLLISGCATSKPVNCEISNAALDAMPLLDVTISTASGETLTFSARHANTNATRAAGFQRVCASTIKQTPILFTFEQELMPSFHMNNVVAPIDIAFIRKSSEIDLIHSMRPYSVMALSKPLYSSKRPVIAALETYSGFFTDNNIGLSSSITWREPSKPR